VDPRTFKRHQEEIDRFQTIASGSQSSSRLKGTRNKPDDVESFSDKGGKRKIRAVEYLSNDDDDNDELSLSDNEPIDMSERVRRRKRIDKFRMLLDDMNLDDDGDGDDGDGDDDFLSDGNGSLTEDEDDGTSETSGTSADDDRGLSEDEVPIEQFTAPDFDDFDYESDHRYPDTNIEFDDSWILLWIFKYQSRFRLSEVAIDSLIKFFKTVLSDADKLRFRNFPTSSYTAKKLLGIVNKEKSYAVCPNCNTLYKVSEILPRNSQNVPDREFKCVHVEFPNHPKHNQRQACGAELTNKIPVVAGYVRRPKMLFPVPSLKTQIISMYQRPGFEELLRKWTNRANVPDLYADIYDGEVWKTFPSSLENPDTRFFTNETADSNLGIMINLDWFQPFDSSVYSSGVIYGVICNLPREVRFKRENMLYLGLLPGPNEVKLHKINHYLSPIVDELLEFWDGFNLPQSNLYPAGKRIRIAVICCTNDIPAARKLCGHISALVSCHRCYKTANISGKKFNYGGFDDMTEWYVQKDPDEHRQNAELWRLCKSKRERKQHVSETHVRWSELLRLPYFNPIRFLVVDPMHNLFLGIAHWIVKRLWVDCGKLTKSHLKLMEMRAKKIQIPADLGRIPYKIATGEGFLGYTADQWKSFIMIYAIPIMWDLLDEADRKILANFVRACTLLICRIIDNNALNEAHHRLYQVARLIEEHYGQEKITPNIHLSLHIAECCKDYGPLYSFWCYSFERMNGVLGKTYVEC
jgi:hypothetical protein